MVRTLGHTSLDAFIDAVVPKDIRLKQPLALPPRRAARGSAGRARGAGVAERSVPVSYLGMGYHDCVTPQVIQRNVLENPGWYTAYTPYQAEIAQGRLEALLNYQTMVSDLTGLRGRQRVAARRGDGGGRGDAPHRGAATRHDGDARVPRIDERATRRRSPWCARAPRRAASTVVVADPATFTFGPGVIGALVQYPATDGRIEDFRALCEAAHAAGALVTAATDLLALTHAHAARRVGRRHRGGHRASASACRWATAARTRRSSPRGTSTSGTCPAASSACRNDPAGRPALRMALQTREQHIRREKATSNICTAQVLLAVMAGMYAVYHGPEGCSRIARARAHAARSLLATGLRRLGYRIVHTAFFDTLCVEVERWASAAAARRGARARHQPAHDRRHGTSASRSTRPTTLRSGGPRRPCSRSTKCCRSWRRTWAPRPATAIPAALHAHLALPDAPGVPHAPLRDRDAALHQAARGPGPLAHVGDDPARLLHHEAQRHDRDDPVTWPRVEPAASVRAARSGAGYQSCSASSKRGSPRSPDSPRCRCSRTPARRASSPGLLVIRAYHARAAKPIATSA